MSRRHDAALPLNWKLSRFLEQITLTVHVSDRVEKLGVGTRHDLLLNMFHQASAWRTSDFQLELSDQSNQQQRFRATKCVQYALPLKICT